MVGVLTGFPLQGGYKYFMPKKVVLIVFILLLAAISAMLWTKRRRAEPVYQGRKLTDWLAEYQKQFNKFAIYPQCGFLPAHPGKPTAAQDAIRQIGTNTIPPLLAMVETHDKRPRVLRNLSELFGEQPEPGADPLVIGNDGRQQAAAGFEALGTAARPAVPALIRLLGNGNMNVRFGAAMSLGMIGQPAEAAVPALLERVDDHYTIVQIFSIAALGEIHADASTVVPGLTNKLVTTSKNGLTETFVMEALGKFGEEAKGALPVITSQLNSTYPEARMSATNALKLIDPEAAARAGVK